MADDEDNPNADFNLGRINTMAEQDEKMKAMDAAAEQAGVDLRKMSQHVTTPVARWWKDNYLKAGHKRLGRVLVAFAKAMEGSGPGQWADADEMEEIHDKIDKTGMGEV